MVRGDRLFSAAAMLSLAACAGDQGQLQIRATGGPRIVETAAVPARIADARGQLALGNAALALEGFRSALRDDPNSIDAMSGIAACYDRMARFDLSRRHYEAALAITPRDPKLLAAFAASLDLQGRAAEAASVRQEVSQRVAVAAKAPSPPPAVAIAVAPTIIAAVEALSMPVLEAAKSPTPVRLQVAKVAPRDPKLSDVMMKQTPLAELRSALTRPATVAAQPMMGLSVTVALPPVRRVAQPALAIVAPTELMPTLTAPRLEVAFEAASHVHGPRLERTSMQEVALITSPPPQWRAITRGSTHRSETVRFVPLRQPRTRVAGIRVLNAARVGRLAARTRSYLTGRGWRGISIGDAAAVRTRSVILYPAGRLHTAKWLSAQFGFAIVQRPGGRQVTILLGRDAARDSALRAKS